MNRPEKLKLLLRRVESDENPELLHKKAIVISGFPGVGKSSLFNSAQNLKILDSDSSLFSWADATKQERHPQWPQNYIDHIREQSDKVDVILVSSHETVRDELLKAGIFFFLVYPSLEMKDEYIQRYVDRGSDDKFVALLSANYEKWINQLKTQKNCEHVILQPGQYLADVVPNIRAFLDKLLYPIIFLLSLKK